MNGEHITSYVDSYYYISGMGITTKQEIKYITKWTASQEDSNGDSIVPVWSADLADRYPDKTFYFDGCGLEYLHTIMLHDDDIHDFINDLIQGEVSCEKYNHIKAERILIP